MLREINVTLADIKIKKIKNLFYLRNNDNNDKNTKLKWLKQTKIKVKTENYRELY